MEAKTYEQYKSEVESWDWKKIKADAEKNATQEEDDQEQLIGRAFLGTVFDIAPSGKYYTPWTSNQTTEDLSEDGKFYQALDDVAEVRGMYIENGEGDPCDLFACINIECTCFSKENMQSPEDKPIHCPIHGIIL